MLRREGKVTTAYQTPSGLAAVSACSLLRKSQKSVLSHKVNSTMSDFFASWDIKTKSRSVSCFPCAAIPLFIKLCEESHAN